MLRIGWSEILDIPSHIFAEYGFSSVDIPLSEGPVNLNWGPIMKTINESPYEFFKEGGWTFLGGGGGGEGVSSFPFETTNIF